MQELKLKIRHIIIVTGHGTDKISFSVPNDQVLDTVLGNTEARENFPELNFDISFPRNKGEKLLLALGLKADENISLEPHPSNFQKLHSGEQTDAGS